MTAFVIGRNLMRRHLTEAQKATIGAKVLPFYEAAARERQRGGKGGVLLSKNFYQARATEQAAAAVGVIRTTSAAAKVDFCFRKILRKQKSTEQAAEAAGTNKQYVKDAKRMKDDLLGQNFAQGRAPRAADPISASCNFAGGWKHSGKFSGKW